MTGAGGLIGGALVAALRGHSQIPIRAIDIKPFDQWHQLFDDVENLSLDLNLKENCEIASRGAKEIYNLAANMGGMGFIENNKALFMLSVLINTLMLQRLDAEPCKKDSNLSWAWLLAVTTIVTPEES